MTVKACFKYTSYGINIGQDLDLSYLYQFDHKGIAL